jgi:nucleoid-associated protein YgaU
VRRALWVRLAAAVALAGLCDPVLAQDVKGADPVRRQAEELAEEASKRFGEVLKAQAPEPKPAGAPTSPAVPETSLPLLLYWLDYSDHEYRGIMRRLALEGAERGWDPATVGWLKRSSQQFQDLMLRLARAGGPQRPSEAVAQGPERNGVESAAPSRPTAPETAMPPAAAPGPAAVPGEAVARLPAPATAVEAPREGPREPAAASPPEAGAGAKEAPESAAAAKPAPALATEAAPTAARPLQPSRKQATREPTNLDTGGDPDRAGAAARPPASPLESASEAARPDKAAALGSAEVAPGAAGAPAPEAPARSEQDASPARSATASDRGPGEAPHPSAKVETLPASEAAKTSGATAGASRPEPAAPPSQALGSDGAAARLGAPAPDRLALNPLPPGAGRLAPGQRPAAAAPASAPAERQASKIAKPADKAQRRRTDKTAVDRCQTAGASVPLPGWYVVKRGDTLWAIAERHYGAGRRYRSIFAANRGRLKRGPDFILPCQQLYLPRQRRRGL